MNKIIITAAILFSCSSSFAQVANDLTKEHLKGKVKSVQSISYYGIKENKSFTRGELLDDLDAHCTEYYNQYGFLTQGICGQNGEQKALFSRDADNTLLESSVSSQGKIISRTRYLYNSKNQLVKETNYNAKNQITGSMDKYYDSLNRKVLELEYSYYFSKKADTILNYARKYIYDQNKLDSTVEIYFYKYRLGQLSITLYNDSGRAIKEESLDAEGNVSEWKKIKYTYDKKGNITAITTLFSDDRGSGKKNSSDYETFEYDESGNWIKRYYTFRTPENTGFEVTEWIEKTIITERKIEYYK